LEEKRYVLTNELDVVTTEKDELLRWRELNSEEWSREKSHLLEKILELEENIDMLRSVTSDSSNKLAMINEKIKGECGELTDKKERLHKEKEELDEKINSLNNEYHSEKKEREKLEHAVSQQQNESGLNLYHLRKKLQSYVWDDMYAWNVLLDIKTDFSLEDLHSEKLDEIKDMKFIDQVSKIESEIVAENIRLVELKEEREKEKHSDPMYVETELNIELDAPRKDKKKNKDKDKSPREDKDKDEEEKRKRKKN